MAELVPSEKLARSNRIRLFRLALMASKQKNSISAKSESVVKIFVARIGSGFEAQLFAAKGANCFFSFNFRLNLEKLRAQVSFRLFDFRRKTFIGQNFGKRKNRRRRHRSSTFFSLAAKCFEASRFWKKEDGKRRKLVKKF